MPATISRGSGSQGCILNSILNEVSSGSRYELYCLSKAHKTPQVTVWCDLSPEDCLAQNTEYQEEVFQALVQRYEAPQQTNRWDSPLFLVLKDRPVPCKEIADSLFNLAPPPPNLSTQNKPLSSTSFLHSLDRMCGDIVQAILDAQKVVTEYWLDMIMSDSKF